ncbi:mannose-6-phosphate isomerase [Arsenophonus nasoniae]|uniref:mannose-6-phosphate isomerase n=1 Tax=Arsenophonus nasoniae TaxID=638 RepID=D2TZG1_9GAMM|nr:mannose-6-phosphate isomerase [Arsenophonus nasoniae]QBY43384.1 Mannose-6-phosphate isomerase [Arsenophonus nasoniae]WGM07375.1 mannose-6-phosphate isomerase [Arsenophonus nasoniae]WGM12248.1 mannose-6-phosphate isomerase [Arsenophonus nasoniae]WGM16926.1 mannose-6-phosphate isomerase [Arsenophonus nasoniae]CBA73023.1 mannose-6-phosphate isomerase (phosphomannose isomerase) (phosphohexomutase) (PMI) [Arsenophonus nasoniae]
MFKMINKIQHYDWGSKDALTKLYHIKNPQHLPMAELWMGAHPKASSIVEDINNQQKISLDKLITTDPTYYLGEKIAQKFHQLPFLFKVLCAAQPLSIQVHPDKIAAEAGFRRENAAGIALDSPNRNYKDDNHKPELIYALTPFKALNSFRPLKEIANLLIPIAVASPIIQLFLKTPSETQLAQLFSHLLSLTISEKQPLLTALKSVVQQKQGEPWHTIKKILTLHPDDNGLFAPLLLNIIELQPGEAMFLYARTPHAYIEGVGLEVMANSDNVLRAGLTNKHIDIAELLANIDFIAKPCNTLLLQPNIHNNECCYPIPVDDFAFSLYLIDNQLTTIENSSATILFCVEGKISITSEKQTTEILAGESIFISASERQIMLNGKGKLARVFNY